MNMQKYHGSYLQIWNSGQSFVDLDFPYRFRQLHAFLHCRPYSLPDKSPVFDRCCLEISHEYFFGYVTNAFILYQINSLLLYSQPISLCTPLVLIDIKLQSSKRYSSRGTSFPTFRIRHRITKHIQKDGAEKLVGEVDGLLAFAAYGIGLVQNRGDAFLFFQGWEGDFNFSSSFLLSVT